MILYLCNEKSHHLKYLKRNHRRFYSHGLAAAGVLAYFTAGSDTTKQASFPISVIEVLSLKLSPA